MKYRNADDWREQAMLRSGGVDAIESAGRRKLAQSFYEKEGCPDADTLADQELYILGKMNMEEYQDYLLFKHSPNT